MIVERKCPDCGLESGRDIIDGKSVAFIRGDERRLLAGSCATCDGRVTEAFRALGQQLATEYTANVFAALDHDTDGFTCQPEPRTDKPQSDSDSSPAD